MYPQYFALFQKIFFFAQAKVKIILTMPYSWGTRSFEKNLIISIFLPIWSGVQSVAVQSVGDLFNCNIFSAILWTVCLQNYIRMTHFAVPSGSIYYNSIPLHIFCSQSKFPTLENNENFETLVDRFSCLKAKSFNKTWNDLSWESTPCLSFYEVFG